MRRASLFVWILLVQASSTALAGTEYRITIPTSLGDTTETFWLQIPEGYEPGSPRPLLVGWHQLGGDEMEFQAATDFPEIADGLGWIAASHHGPTPTHWSNQAAQSHVVDVIRWIEERYAVDTDRIYMVGSSMGGAAGMVFSNNHLDPRGVRVAAAASISGIQDCDRRFHEQGYNNSMVGAFGGTPEEVPFEYHRNSAIFFADSLESMHRNGTHLPLWLTFGSGISDSIWRAHSEDLYAVMEAYADTVILRESPLAGHGWVCAEEEAICGFLSAFRADRHPASFAVQADEEGAWYACALRARRDAGRFARFDAAIDAGAARFEIAFLANVEAADIDPGPVGFPLDGRPFSFRWEIRDPGRSELGILGVPMAPAAILRDGSAFLDWSYEEASARLRLDSQGAADYLVQFDPSGVPASAADAGAIRVWVAGGEIRITASFTGARAWTLHDLAGRRIASGKLADASRRIPVPSGIARGVYFITLAPDGAPACAPAWRVLLPSTP